MESHGPVQQEAHRVAGPLAGLADADGPFVTVHLTTEGAIENAAQKVDAQWRALRSELEAADAPAGALDAIAEVTDGAHTRGPSLYAVATADRLLVAESLDVQPARDFGRVASLPVLAPLLTWRQSSVPHVVVVADRTGADVTAVPRRGEPIEEEVEPDHGRDPVQRSKPGGWSQRRYQERVQNTWAATADEVAEVVVRMVGRVGARAVLLAGDVRAVELLQKSLPDEVGALVEVVPGTRADDGSDAELEDAVARHVRTVAANETVGLLDKFREERGQHDRAADGPEATLLALAKAQVDTLLVAADPDDSRTAWFGPDPTLVAADAQTLRDLGVDEPVEGALADVAVRAALGTGAGVWVVPAHGGPTDGVGAILRWAD
jgi:hypothetical protein